MRDGWVQTRLDEVANVTMGQSPPGSTYNDQGNGLPFIQGNGEFGTDHPTPNKWCSEPRKVAQRGDVLLSVRAPVGATNIANRETAIGRGLAVLTGKPGLAETRFIRLLLQGSAPALAVRSTGSTFDAITGKALKALPVSVPPIEEQRRIVDLMSHVDDALRSCDALVSAEGALLDAASEALVFSPEFPLMKVGDLAEGKRGLVGGPFGSSLVGRDYVETGVPVIRGQNLQGRYVSGDFVFVSEEKSRSLHGNQATPGDVVFTQRGTLGQVSLIPDDAYPNYVVSQSQMRLTPDRSIVSADWVYHAFRTPRMVQRIKRADTSTANPHINLGILRTMDVPIPSVDMQAQVCSQLNAIEASIVAKMAESEALKSTRGALLSALLGGTHQIPSSYDEFIRDEGAA